MLRTAAIMTLLLALGASQASSEELIHWHNNLATARQISQQYKVPMLVHFYGDQCMPCESLEKNVFTRPEVASTIQRYFVPVKINATTDRKTAAEFGVHSWPTDVFLGPDGKALTQGVCSQNPNAYLQNLQSVALMNRDRNAMLAGAPKPAAAETGNGSPYGRTAASNLQQAAPGRDAAPTPYNNPANGASPYAQGAPQSSLTAANMQSGLPSPTWQGQSAHGQAQSGLVNAGPVNNATSMTLPPPQPAYAQDNRQSNIPPNVQWQTGAPVSSSPFSQNSALVNDSPKLPLAPTLPSAAMPTPAMPALAMQNATSTEVKANPVQETISNPYYGNQNMPGMPGTPATAAPGRSGTAPGTGVPSQLVSSDSSIVRSEPAITEKTLATKPSVPALDGYCPVTLMRTQTWVRGLEKHAIRHRGKVYLLSSEETAKEFMSAPDSFTPVLSGHDPLVFLREGKLVEGTIYDGVLRQDNLLFLFSSDENKEYFRNNYERLLTELESAISQAAK